MAADRMTIRMDSKLRKEIKKEASAQGKTATDVIVEVMQAHFRGPCPGESAYDLAKRLGVIGVLKGGPPDLSTNKKYFEGFGKSRNR